MSALLQTGWAFLKRDFLAADVRKIGLRWFKAAVFAVFWFVVTHWVRSTPWITVSGLRVDYYTYSLVGWVIGRSVVGQIQESFQEVLRIKNSGQYYFWKAGPVPLFWLFLFSNGWEALVSAGSVAVTLAAGVVFFQADLTGIHILQIAGVTLLSLVPTVFLGMLLAAGEIRWRESGKMVQSALNPFLMITNGVFLPVSHFPLWVQAVAGCSPLTHALVLARGLAFGNGMVSSVSQAWAGLGMVTLLLATVSAAAVSLLFYRPLSEASAR